VAIISYSQYLLSIFNKFHHENVLLLAGLLTFIALLRFYTRNKFDYINSWEKKDLISLILIFFSGIPLMVILGFDAFQHADEVTSWNLWARELYFEKEVSFENTAAAYPLLLSSLLAFCYKFIGNIDYQLPLKFTFSIFYLSTVFIIFSFANTKKKIGIFVVTYILIFLILGVGFEYKKVWADTLMSGLLVSSLALLLSLSNTENITNKGISTHSLLIASIILICSATLTKQGAIPWTAFIFPLLAYLIIRQNNTISNKFNFFLIVPISTPFLWYLISGKNFHSNVGVISRSMNERSYLEQFIFGFNESFIKDGNIVLLVFMVIVFIILLKNINLEKAILSLGISLSTILLIFFGAYETTRLYLHIILSSYLFIFIYGDNFITNKIGYIVSRIGNSFFTYLLVGSLIIFWTINSFNDRKLGMKRVSNFLDGREVQANWIFGDQGAEQYRNIIKSNKRLWGEDNHVQGIYYGLDIFDKGALNNSNISLVVKRIIDEDIGWIYAKGSIHLDTLLESCEGSITEYKTNSYSENNLYKISLEKLITCNEIIIK
jgi:hypothetical protein